ncbi:superoxide dismutase family protein [Novosphingobium sp.]|uniref:superoxide dismutase family protein n=1 Tax=Novosphingobium sp. TaxID=1874826 RepID=UPI00286A8924|nr:superoxide dismutase family protein [Novosphingobium sp.]
MTRLIPGSIVFTALLAGCTSLGEVPTAKVATTTVYLANGLPAGTAVITAAGDRLTLNLAATGLAPGTHGVHLHMVGTCTAPGFASAGSHLNPSARQHGSANPGGSHMGDLPNLVIDVQGRGVLSAQLGGNRPELEAALFDSDGTALVIHAQADDYKTDPTGNSGERIACGVIKRS